MQGSPARTKTLGPAIELWGIGGAIVETTVTWSGQDGHWQPSFTLGDARERGTPCHFYRIANLRAACIGLWSRMTPGQLASPKPLPPPSAWVRARPPRRLPGLYAL